MTKREKIDDELDSIRPAVIKRGVDRIERDIVNQLAVYCKEDSLHA